MSKYFVIHEDNELFSTHGAISCSDIYKAYNSPNGLADSFMVAGFYNHSECRSKIKSIEDIVTDNYYNVFMSASLMSGCTIKVYDKQIFMDQYGKPLTISDISKPGTQIVSLNGMLTVNHISKEDVKSTFYIVECEKDMPSIYCSNVLIFPIEESEKENPFFINLKED